MSHQPVTKLPECFKNTSLTKVWLHLEQCVQSDLLLTVAMIVFGNKSWLQTYIVTMG